MTQDTFSIFQKIAPDLMGTIKERYLLLRHIADSEPVGRRTLAGLSGLSERVVRSHVDVLRRSGIVRFTTMGIAMEPEGRKLMPDLLECFLHLNNLDDLQQQIRQALGLKNVYIVPGDCDNDKTAKEELGRQGALLLNDVLNSVDTVAISGGSTMAEVARMLPESMSNVTMLPARGSMGNHVEFQANYIAASIAAKTHSSYRMIHLPEGLSESALKLMYQSDRQARESAAMVARAQAVIFGIGRADHMARKRGMSLLQREALQNLGACGESLGCYCGLNGQIVYGTNNIGVSLKEIRHHTHVIAVAGGASKAEAIVSVMRTCRTGVLVTDEGAAKKIVQLL
jgi:central glycolytic genes regulator